MITKVVSRQGNVIHLLSKDDLGAIDAIGARLRAYCPIHGSDHQRSLSIDASSGWGFCHCCHATVLVEEYAPDVAETLRRGASHYDSVGDPPKSATLRRATSSHPVVSHSLATRSPWQREEVAAICAAWPLMCEELESARAAAYFDERAIPPEVACACGLGYCSRAVWADAPVSAERQALLRRWIGRIVFPLGSPDGRGFIGRTLLHWERGMDEREHKAVLEAEEIPRWLKTNPAGWYGPHPSRYAPTLILVEGGFDRLALIAAGIPSQAIVALVGTAAKVEWIIRFAPQVKRIILALDGDESGMDAMERLADAFRHAGLALDLCPPPQDGAGKDWNERYRRCGDAGIAPLIHRVTQCQM